MEIEDAAVVLKVLGDPTRLTMMKILEHRTCCVCELVEIFPFSQPAISQHLRKLKDAGLVREEKRGQWNFYSIDSTSVHYAMIQPILAQLADQEEKIKQLEKASKKINCC